MQFNSMPFSISILDLKFCQQFFCPLSKLHQKSEHYKIEFYREARHLVKEKVWANSQVITESKDKTIIEFDSTQFLKIKAWVLSNGCNAKPIAPAWLVKEWKRHAVEMAKMAEETK